MQPAQCSTAPQTAFDLNACALDLTTTLSSTVVDHNITINADGASVVIPFTIWAPVLDILVVLEESVLHPIDGMFSTTTPCTALYQTTNIAMSAVCTNGVDSVTADVTEDLMHLVVVNSAVAILEPSISSTGMYDKIFN